MTMVLILISLQGFIGAIDNLWHHEITEKLSSRPGARNELALHTAREFIYAVIFTTLAWVSWNGVWTLALAALLAIEIVITLWDFVIEDKTRVLPPFERVLHTILALNFGAVLAFLVPVLIIWAARPIGFGAVDYGFFSWLLTAYGIGVLAWAFYDLKVVFRLSIAPWQRRPIKAGTRSDAKTVLITGATGFIGQNLTRRLIERGDRPVVLTRDAAKAHYLFGPHVTPITTLNEIRSGAHIDAIINLAGEPTLGGLWTRKRKQKLISSRVDMTRDLIDLIRRLPHPPEVLISGSAIGYYGNCGGEKLIETSAPQDIFMSDMCALWEEEARRAETLGVRVCRLRIGLVLGTSGGAFPALIRPVKFGLGAVFGKGVQWMSWIHERDLVRLMLFALDTKDAQGALNATAPEPVTNEAFTKTAAQNLRRPLFLRIPAIVLKRTLGDLADLFVEGQRVLPNKALKLGFTFEAPTLDVALTDLLGKGGTTRNRPQSCELFFNDTCRICDAEIDHYKRQTARHDLDILFRGIGQGAARLKAFGLTQEHLKRRIYVLDASGTLYAGVDAFQVLWTLMPRYRWLAASLRNPAVYALADFVYEGLAAPLLYRWGKHREKRATRRHAHG